MGSAKLDSLSEKRKRGNGKGGSES
jgi:hypothetical protein